MLVEKILDHLNVFYDDPAKVKHGSCPEITWGTIVQRIVEDKGSCSAHTLFPEIGEQTFNRMMRKCFQTKLNGGMQTWYFHLLSLVGYKLCGTCTMELELSLFNRDKNNSSLGVSSLCKECISKEQAGGYTKYIVAHKRSYEKHYAEIRARQQLYRGQRSLRVPSWYESQKKEIEHFYDSCPKGYQVDHIIPLKGELVSGLHVLQNLQYLSAKDNMSKGNKYDIE
jgi:hypothetical protein